MTLLITGLVLWVATHMFKRTAPAARARLQSRLGDGSKGVVAAVLLVALVLMVLGYRHADVVVLWQGPLWLVHVNNLLMIVAVFLMGVGNSKCRARGWLRHPMLTAVVVWSVAHLLVNGDLPSLVLFGGLLVWAVAEMVIINRAEPDYHPFSGGTLGGDMRLAAITAAVFVVVVLLHGWLGPSPFGAQL